MDPVHAVKVDANGGHEAHTRGRRTFETVVTDVVMETHDSATLFLHARPEDRDYRAGQFLTIDPHQFDALRHVIGYLEDAKGAKEPPRAYSMASGPHDKDLAITIKIEPYVSGETKYPPLLSPFLVRSCFKGMPMVVAGHMGHYAIGPEIAQTTDHIVHIAAGSGIVPNYAMIRWALETGQPVRHTLVYGNKTWNDVIYRRQFDDLIDRFHDKLRIVHALTRESNFQQCGSREVRHSRVTEALLREVIEDPRRIVTYTCGPAITRWEKIRAR
jgi:3-ketosteroid 9alpha-monooxygenase subunit B